MPPKTRRSPENADQCQALSWWCTLVAIPGQPEGQSRSVCFSMVSASHHRAAKTHTQTRARERGRHTTHARTQTQPSEKYIGDMVSVYHQRRRGAQSGA